MTFMPQTGSRLALALLVLWAAGPARGEDRTAGYLYEDTRQLVRLVEDAAKLIESRGDEAFKEFAVRGSRWFDNTHYLFVYDLNGVNLFHPMTAELVGRNVMNIKDMDGRPISVWATDIGRRPEPNASGWIFYLWEENTQFTPSWKSSYIRKAVEPGGRVCVVGSGIYNMRVEKVFVQQRVDMAADLLQAEGREKAFAQFRNPASPFQFLGTYIFVMSSDGHMIEDPAFPTIDNRDMTRFKDAAGRSVVNEMLAKLEANGTNHSAWVQYMQPKIGNLLPARKLVYVRRVLVDNQWLIVGADFSLATPIWMTL